MSRVEHIHLMAKYNEWMNERLYKVASNLTDQELSVDRRAFFGSILGTLNHLAVADTIWLKRFASHPSNYAALEHARNFQNPTHLDQKLYTDIQSLVVYRKTLDQIITAWTNSITEDDLDHVLQYQNTKGISAGRNFFSLIMHFFNHQTHHRGQTTTLLSQAGVDIGATDLLVIIPDEEV
jgi:uncharacterized damage-inducible protein DinB